jgi:hypothetical protein
MVFGDAHIARHRAESGEVRSESIPLARKPPDELREIPIEARLDIEAFGADEQMIEPIGIELAELEVACNAQALEQTTNAAALPQIADVVNAGARTVLFEREALRPAPGR